MAKRKELKNMSFEEFNKIITQLKDAFDFENDMLELSKKYINKQVLFDYISTSSTYLASSVWTLLNKVFNLHEDDDLFSWWCLECEFGNKFKIGDLEDKSLKKNHKFRQPDLTTVEGLYDYAVFCSERTKQ